MIGTYVAETLPFAGFLTSEARPSTSRKRGRDDPADAALSPPTRVRFASDLVSNTLVVDRYISNLSPSDYMASLRGDENGHQDDVAQETEEGDDQDPIGDQNGEQASLAHSTSTRRALDFSAVDEPESDTASNTDEVVPAERAMVSDDLAVGADLADGAGAEIDVDDLARLAQQPAVQRGASAYGVHLNEAVDGNSDRAVVLQQSGQADSAASSLAAPWATAGPLLQRQPTGGTGNLNEGEDDFEDLGLIAHRQSGSDRELSSRLPMIADTLPSAVSASTAPAAPTTATTPSAAPTTAEIPAPGSKEGSPFTIPRIAQQRNQQQQELQAWFASAHKPTSVNEPQPHRDHSVDNADRRGADQVLTSSEAVPLIVARPTRPTATTISVIRRLLSRLAQPRSTFTTQLESGRVLPTEAAHSRRYRMVRQPGSAFAEPVPLTTVPAPLPVAPATQSARDAPTPVPIVPVVRPTPVRSTPAASASILAEGSGPTRSTDGVSSVQAVETVANGEGSRIANSLWTSVSAIADAQRRATVALQATSDPAIANGPSTQSHPAPAVGLAAFSTQASTNAQWPAASATLPPATASRPGSAAIAKPIWSSSVDSRHEPQQAAVASPWGSQAAPAATPASAWTVRRVVNPVGYLTQQQPSRRASGSRLHLLRGASVPTAPLVGTAPRARPTAAGESTVREAPIPGSAAAAAVAAQVKSPEELAADYRRTARQRVNRQILAALVDADAPVPPSKPAAPVAPPAAAPAPWSAAPAASSSSASSPSSLLSFAASAPGPFSAVMQASPWTSAPAAPWPGQSVSAAPADSTHKDHSPFKAPDPFRPPEDSSVPALPASNPFGAWPASTPSLMPATAAASPPTSWPSSASPQQSTWSSSFGKPAKLESQPLATAPALPAAGVFSFAAASAADDSAMLRPTAVAASAFSFSAPIDQAVEPAANDWARAWQAPPADNGDGEGSDGDDDGDDVDDGDDDDDDDELEEDDGDDDDEDEDDEDQEDQEDDDDDDGDKADDDDDDGDDGDNDDDDDDDDNDDEDDDDNDDEDDDDNDDNEDEEDSGPARDSSSSSRPPQWGASSSSWPTFTAPPAAASPPQNLSYMANPFAVAPPSFDFSFTSASRP